MRERFLLPGEGGPRAPVAVIEGNDRAFEVAVFNAIKQELDAVGGEREALNATLTPRSADRGRDIVVRDFRGGRFLGFDLSETEAPRSIYVECKLSGKDRLSLDHVAANVLQLEFSPQDVFLLVTNASLTPRALSAILRQCERLGLAFLLIDAWNFGRSLPALLVSPGRAESPQEDTDALVSYQVLKSGPGTDEYLVHFIMRAVGTPVDIEIALHSTRDWKSRSDGASTLYGTGVSALTIALVPAGPRTPRSFHVALLVGGKRRIFQIPLMDADEIARLPIFASDMSRTFFEIRSRFAANQLARLTHIHGKAGTGKSRLLAELFAQAKMQDSPCRFIQVNADGSAVVKTCGMGKMARRNLTSVELATYFLRLVEDQGLPVGELILVDDIHAAPTSILDDILSLAMNARSAPSLLTAGRSDPTFRRPAYDAFDQRLREHTAAGQIEHHRLDDMNDTDIHAAVHSLFEGRAAGLIGLGRRSQLRPVDFVHAVHSLMERGHVYWTDEETLSLAVHAESGTDYFSDQEILSGILEFRYRHVREIKLDGFSLAGFLETLAVVDDREFAYSAARRLLSETDIVPDVLSLWLEIDPIGRVASFRHSTLRDFLTAKFYGFESAPQSASVLQFAAGENAAVSRERRAAFAISDGDLPKATSLIAPFAAQLRKVKNISSLSLSEADYNNFATLFAILALSRRLRPALIHRCVVSRAYLNSHHRSYSLGFIDNLRLVGVVEALPAYSHKNLTIAAAKQLMAHTLINGGDSRTALTLMHEVSNLIEMQPGSRVAKTIEFDMCDRLQSYYAHQSAFRSARMFFFRGRRCANAIGDPAVLNLSFSAEFHLTRYLNVENALRLAERQVRHAEGAAPTRTLFHARANYIVARWTESDESLSEPDLAEIARLRTISRREGFGHLVPRLDYLQSVHALQEWRAGRGDLETLEVLLKQGNEAAREYGYEDYVWLLDSLELIRLIQTGARHQDIARKAAGIIDHLHNIGLTCIAGEELCFQNTIALSNALRALHQYSDQDTAWRSASKITFSPLFLPKPADRARRIEAAFSGSMLNHNYDPRALFIDNDRYAVILV